MSVSPEREMIIRTAWKERGSHQWNPEVHGRGAPLIIPATTPKPGQPIPADDNLEFRLGNVDNEPVNEIVCEGVILESFPIQFI